MNIGCFFSQVDLAVDNGEVAKIEDALSKYAPLGLSFVDIHITDSDKRYKLPELLRRIKSCDVVVGSVFNWRENFPTDENLLNTLNEDSKLRLAQTAELECELYMPVPVRPVPFNSKTAREDYMKLIAEHLNFVVNEAKQYNITTMVENYSLHSCTFADRNDIAYYLENVPGLGFVLDTGNFWFNNEDSFEAGKLFKDRVPHIHLKDILPMENGPLAVNGMACESAAIGDGKTPIKEILTYFKDLGYNKGATIEINDSRDMVSKTIRSLNYINDVLK